VKIMAKYLWMLSLAAPQGHGTGVMWVGGLTLMSSPASAQKMVDLHVPGGPSTRLITTSYPQKGRMILQRSSPPWLETPFEVFDTGVFTPDQHCVSGTGRIFPATSMWMQTQWATSRYSNGRLISSAGSAEMQ
jgi:hypothetical protein